MTVELIIMGASDNHTYEKGDIVDMFPDGKVAFFPYSAEHPFVHVKVTGVTYEQARPYLELFYEDYDVEDEGSTLLIKCKHLTKTNWIRLNSAKRQRIRKAFQNYGYALNEFEIVVDSGLRIPKRHSAEKVAAYINDDIRQMHKARRYKLTESDVDYALANNTGYIEITKSQLLNRFIDKVE